MATICRFGCIRDCDDGRDKKKVYDINTCLSCSSKVDLRRYVPRIYFQGNLESCTANAVCSAYEIDLVKQLGTCTSYFNPPSRMFLWYNARLMEDVNKPWNNLVTKNASVSLRNTIKAFHRYGVCTEEILPYTGMLYKDPPSKTAFDNAKGKDIKAEYESLTGTDITQLRACLHQGSPVVFGFDVYNSFKTSVRSDGIMPQPDFKTGEGHAVVAVGYDDTTRCMTILNSWGEKWGDRGYFYMPYWFITSGDSHSFWKISFAYEKLKVCTRCTHGFVYQALPRNM